MNDTLYATRFNTPLGAMIAIAADEGLCLLEFEGGRRVAREQEDLQRLTGRRIRAAAHPLLAQAEREIGEYFQAGRRQFEVPLFTPDTPFRQQVWQVLLTIPYGQTRSYQQQAEALGNPAAVRAVASANGANRVSIIIPCHRVIGKDGSLTGYGGGLQRKMWLLQHEQGQTAPDDCFQAA